MAIQEQTNFWSLVTTIPVKTFKSICIYVLFVIKLYVIGAVALVLQLLEKPAPVRGLLSQSGKTAIVTGGACGIGFHVCRQLARLGANVIIACRSEEEGQAAVHSITQDWPEAQVSFMELELASFTSVRKFVADFEARDLPLHILINNAGIMLAPHQETEDGYERHLQVNYLSHALLTSLLEKKMATSAQANSFGRIVNVSSIVHHVASLTSQTFAEKQRNDWTYSPHNAYASSKLAVTLYTYTLSRRWSEAGSKVTVNAVHPGVVNTHLYRHVHWSIGWAMDILRRYLFMSAEQSALSLLHVATSPSLEGTTGCYFSNCLRTGSSPVSRLPSLQEDIFVQTQQIIGKKLD